MINFEHQSEVFKKMAKDSSLDFGNTPQRKYQSGMGFSIIERRDEDLGGNVMIESQSDSGTSVIVDIPL